MATCEQDHRCVASPCVVGAVSRVRSRCAFRRPLLLPVSPPRGYRGTAAGSGSVSAPGPEDPGSCRTSECRPWSAGSQSLYPIGYTRGEAVALARSVRDSAWRAWSLASTRPSVTAVTVYPLPCSMLSHRTVRTLPGLEQTLPPARVTRCGRSWGLVVVSLNDRDPGNSDDC